MKYHLIIFCSLSSLVLLGTGCEITGQPEQNQINSTKNAPAQQVNRQDSNAPEKNTISLEDETDKPGTEQNYYTSYSGAYFDIEYPANFRVDERVLEGSAPDKYAEVAFVSPNENVEFYVYSPLWGGVADYETILETEEIVAEQQSSTGEGHWEKTVDWVTVEAKDGSYARSMRIITTNDDTVRYLFGIKYTSQEALDEYREEYNHFTNSLKQYADA